MSGPSQSLISQAISIDAPVPQPREASVNLSDSSYSLFYFEVQSVVQEQHSSLHPRSSASSPQAQESAIGLIIQKALRQFDLGIHLKFNPNNSTVYQKDENSHDETSFLNNSCIQQLIASEDDQQDEKDQYNLFDKHAQEVIAYLMALSNPSGEINQIQQHLKGFKVENIDHQSMNDNNEWIWTTKIHLPDKILHKDRPRTIESTQSKPNKHRAKEFAAFDLLKSLYLTYPQVWYEYKDVKEVKKLPFSEKKHQHPEIKLLLDKNDFQKISNETMIQFQSRQEIHIRSMMQKISAKTQRNLLIQHLSGKIASAQPLIYIKKWKMGSYSQYCI